MWVDMQVNAMQKNRCWDVAVQMRVDLQMGCRALAVQVDLVV